MTKKIDCTASLQAAVDKLEAEGVDTVSIVTALTNIAVSTAKDDPRLAPAHLDAMASIISAAADLVRARRVFKQIDEAIEGRRKHVDGA